jgi:hypothetical protein
MEYLFTALREPTVRIVVLAVVLGSQVSQVLSSIVFAVSNAVQLFVSPHPVAGFNVAQVIRASLASALIQVGFSLAIAVATVWLLSRVLASLPRRAA